MTTEERIVYSQEKPKNVKCTDLRKMLQSPNGLVDWDIFVSALSLYPSEAKKRDKENGKFLLHLAAGCKNPPPSAMKMLINAYRGAACFQDFFAQTPFSTAWDNENLSSEVLRMILEAFPDASLYPGVDFKTPLHTARDVEKTKILIHLVPDSVTLPDEDVGKLPIHYAVGDINTPPEIIQLLLTAGKEQNIGGPGGGGGVFHYAWGNTPLSIASRAIEKFHCKNSDENGRPLPLVGFQAHRRWEKLSILVREAYSASRGLAHVTPIPLLHSIIELGLSWKIVWHAIMINPIELTKQDIFGRTPLAVAAMKSTTPCKVFDVLLNNPFEKRQAACTRDLSGKFPLHHIANSGRQYDKAVEFIINAAPSVLGMRDEINGLYPFMVAASGGNYCIDFTFNLLRESPDLISFFVL